MPMRADAPSFIPKMNRNAPSFIPSDVAASNIQRRFRGNRTRNLTKKKDRAAKAIQSRFRGNRSRTGKSKQWGLPFPKSRRDELVDPYLTRRIMDESITNLRDGIYGIEDEIEDLERKFVSNRRNLDKINDQLNNPNSALSRGKQAKQDRFENYLDQETEKRMDQFNGLPDYQFYDYVREKIQDEYDADDYAKYKLDYDRDDPELSSQQNKKLFDLSKKYTDAIADKRLYELAEENIMEERD